MSNVVKVTADERRQARLAGFRKKKPKKPKSKTETSLNRYVERYNVWAKDLKSAAKEGKKKEAEKKRLADLKRKVQSL